MLVKFSREGVKALEDFCHDGRVGDGGAGQVYLCSPWRKCAASLRRGESVSLEAARACAGADWARKSSQGDRRKKNTYMLLARSVSELCPGMGCTGRKLFKIWLWALRRPGVGVRITIITNAF